MNPALIPFVFGHPRSGTSLLTAILDRHSHIAMAPETHLLHALRNESGDRGHEHLLVVAWDVLRTRMGDLHFTPPEILARFRQHPSSVEGLLFAILELWADRAGKPVAGEKTPAHLWFADRILDHTSRARAILLVRDGRAVVEAMTRTERHRDTPLDQLVQRWAEAAACSDRWLGLYPDRANLVRYEDLVEDPRGCLGELMNSLGLEYEEAMLQPGPTATYRQWERYAKREASTEVNSAKAVAWRAGQALLSAGQLRRLRPWLQRFGYEPEGVRETNRPGRSRPKSAVRPAQGGESSPADSQPILIIGARRAGCASLAKWLCGHPALGREVSYARPCLALDWPLTSHGFMERITFHPSAPTTSRDRQIHAASYYLAHPDMPRRVAQVVPAGRIIVLLRDPVLRSYSHWLHEWRMGAETLTFEEALSAEARRLAGTEEQLLNDERAVSFAHIHYSYRLQSRYQVHLARWGQAFGSGQILVVTLEEVIRDPTATAARLCHHVGLRDADLGPFPVVECLAWPLQPASILNSSAGQALRRELSDEVGGIAGGADRNGFRWGAVG